MLATESVLLPSCSSCTQYSRFPATVLLFHLALSASRSRVSHGVVPQSYPVVFLGGRENIATYKHDVRNLGFALMNANIRANLDEKDTLERLVQIVKRHKEAGAVNSRVEAYEKAKQHQGEYE